MSTLAILAALSAAASWAVASVAISRLLEHGHVTPAAANLFKNGLAAFCFFVAALTLGGRWPVGEAWGWLFLSGLLGFTVADTLYFAAFRRCGVQTAATVMLLNVPIATVLAVPLAGDAIQTQMLPFMAVVLVGVLLVILDARHGRGGDPSSPRGRSSYAIGVGLAMCAAFAIGTAVPLGRGRFDEVGVCPGGFIRLLGGAIGAFPLALLVGLRQGSSATAEVSRLIQPLFVAPGPASVWGRASLTGVGCAIFGLLPYHYALRELPGGVSALLFASTPLFTLPLALFVGQRAGPVGILGTLVGFAGVAGILLGDAPDRRLEGLRLEVTRVTVPGPTSARFPSFVERMTALSPLERGSPGDGSSASDATGAVRAVPPLIASATSAAAGDDGWRVVLLGGRDPSMLPERTLVEPGPGSPADRGPLFVNWADLPRATRLASGALLVATLERIAAESTFAHGVRLSIEEDGPPARDLGWLHDDASAVEHGFVTLVPEIGGSALAVWLDARPSPSNRGAQLLARTIRANGERLDEIVLDDRVCDCCPTDAALLDDGTVVVAYRDRSDSEVRDIWTVRRLPGAEGGSAEGGRTDGWTDPAPVHEDGWRIEGCPVSGPAVAASGRIVAVAWFTQAEGLDVRRVRVAFSRNRGRTYDAPIDVAVGATQGRVDLASVGDGRFVLVHLAEVAGADGATSSASWSALLLAPGAAPSAPVRIADVEPERRSGRLELAVSAPSGAAGSASGPDGLGSVTAVWTSGVGVQGARIDVRRGAATSGAPALSD